MATKKMNSKAIQGKTLFFVTSPRTPFKTIPEIALLDENFHGEIWNPETQSRFYRLLRDHDFFEGEEAKDTAFAGRDRINRIPKQLGFVTLPVISLTPVGSEFIESNNREEILLRQMLKFQLPSPYHPLGKKATDYCVKPYLELFRLIRDLDYLSYDELHIFGMQLVNYNRYNDIKTRIQKYRIHKEKNKSHYRALRERVFYSEAAKIYQEELELKDYHTRESKTTTQREFLKKKISNMRDYADAALRNLRSTGLVQVTAIGRTLRIIPERKADVDYFLETIEREPCFVTEQEQYESYLWNTSIPRLLTDDREGIIEKLYQEFGITVDPSVSLNTLKGILNRETEKKKEERIKEQVKELKDYKLYDEIEETFDTMENSYEPSLFFEWNTWRAMTMLNGGTIKANLKYDDEGLPMSTALGKMADIECDYGDFDMIVEVSRSSGALQFKMEGEPVPRHIGIHKEKTKKPTYCFFIAPIINASTIAHFYSLYLSNVELYGGRCRIIPMTLSSFRKMIKDAVYSPIRPTPKDIKQLFEKSNEFARECFINDETENDWYSKVTAMVNNWLSVS